jgi:hypothetical protein
VMLRDHDRFSRVLQGQSAAVPRPERLARQPHRSPRNGPFFFSVSEASMHSALLGGAVLAGLAAMPVALDATAAPVTTATRPLVPTWSSNAIKDAYYYHGRYYPYHYGGRYYHHRYYRGGHWHYY